MQFIRVPVIAIHKSDTYEDPVLNEILNPNADVFHSESLVNIGAIQHIIQGKKHSTIYYKSGDTLNVYLDVNQIECLINEKLGSYTAK